MKKRIPIRRTMIGYTLLIVVAILEQLILFWHVAMQQSFGVTELLVMLGSLLGLIIGFWLPRGVSVVLIYIFFVTYFVWMVTIAPLNTVVFFNIFLIPANTLLALVVKYSLIDTRRLYERLEELHRITPQVDVDTTLGNREALNEALIKHSNLARRYADEYSFCMAMFKIEFLPLVQESVGSAGYARLLLELSDTIQKQLRFEDYKFSIDNGRFIIICPMTNKDYLQPLTRRIRDAMMNVHFPDARGRELQLVIRSGALVFQKDQFEKYESLDSVIAALERNTETDLIGEYI
ncbi:GGDEF domain-containing protein [Paenibacillus campi]|uniref:GGDEF domain-containing protein n=1 Tax=Paenibacillus campi TaxID=3106031 RepID=UPI002AFE78E7|nr:MULTISPECIES: GGDEF domain-containing protein [unclassified Paenibacillus]